ncbi:MAG: 2-oxo acid dehydrogenase subunit E2 [Holosporaceae bacterium]|jgi:pyruvate/2-oxoglutarate dehydrogenase complex dihydrolipoamide acyltransferase (E2) component|nr:2-oxo acid dehydrogenase subunit E2 [Holosporaceae bacterium]
MRIDIIVPTFDAASYEVTLTIWYKKVGDRIAKNEVIADAETATIACGITSSYDCILAKIIAPEGSIVTQGSRIAIIETNVNADISDIIKTTELEEMRKTSLELAQNIQQDIAQQNMANTEAAFKYEREMERKRQDEYENTRKTRAIRNSRNFNEEMEKNNQKTSIPTEYLLSVSDGSRADQQVKMSSFSSIADSLTEEIMEIAETEENVLEELSEETAEKFKHILKTTEHQAKEEAKKLKEKILEEAKKVAIAQAEDLKAKILEECEEKASKDAAEMHDKIIRGSISEAEKTKAELINEAVKNAKQEAEIIQKEIIQNAQKDAAAKAEKNIQEIIAKAKNDAKIEAEQLSKKIVEDAIRDSKNEAKIIKKEILHSAQKFAAKETGNILKESLRDAKKKSNIQAKEIIELTMEETLLETQSLRKNALKAAYEEAERLKLQALESAKNEVEVLKSDILRATLNGAETLKQETLQSAAQEVEALKRETLLSTAQETERLKSGILQSVISESSNLKEEVLSSARSEISALLDDIRNQTNFEVQNAISQIVESLKIEVDKKLKNTCETAIHKINKKVMPHFAAKNIDQEEGRSGQNDVVNQLLHASFDNPSPEMFADSWRKPTFFPTPGDKMEPIDPLRQRISEKMRSSIDSSVTSTVSNEADMSAILAMEKTFGEEFAKKYNTRLGFTPFFILASISALKQYRMFNAHIINGNLIYKNQFDISIITSGNDGVSAPVIRNADILSVAEIERAMITLSKRAIEGTLSIEEVSGGTFTVINAGIYGSLVGGMDLLTSPQVATLSVHRMHNRPVAMEDGVEVRPMLYISLSYDHRVADTKTASEFLSCVKDFIENPGWTLLGLHN